MTFNVLDHLGVTVPAEPLLPIASQSARTPCSSRPSQPVSLLASLSGSRVSNTESIALTPQSCKVMHLSTGPLSVVSPQINSRERIVAKSNTEPLLPFTTCTASGVKADTISKLLEHCTAAEVDYSLSIDEKAALLPLLESTEKEARETFNKRNIMYLQQTYRPDTEAARLQLETIAENKRRADEEKKERIRQEKQEINDILTEIYIEHTANSARELKKKIDYQRGVEEFRRQEDEIKRAQDSVKQMEKEEESKKAHEYINEMKARATLEAEQRRLEAIKNQEFVNTLIENKRQAKAYEKIAEKMMDCYAGPEDKIDILRAHERKIKEFLKDADQEAKRERDQRVIEEKERQNKDREESRIIRREIYDSQLNYMAYKKEEAAALKQEYDKDMQAKKAIKQQEKEIERQEAKSLKSAVDSEERKAKSREQNLANQNRAWMKANLNENIREKEINAKFNMLLDKIKEYK